jgi:hypothetical protein
MDFVRDDAGGGAARPRDEKKASLAETEANRETADGATAIVGRWKSPSKGWDVGDWGPSQTLIVLSRSGKITVQCTINRDPGPGHNGESSRQVFGAQGAYRVSGDTLTTDLPEGVLARGPIAFRVKRVKGDRLTLTFSRPPGGEAARVVDFVRDDVEKNWGNSPAQK